MKRATIVLLVAAAAAACGDSSGPVISSPTIQLVSPDWGTAGTEVTITGTAFATDSPAVRFGTAAAASVTAVSATELRAVVPDAFSSTTLLDVRITNPDGGTATLAGGFEYVIPPVADSIAPVTGTIGTEVRIYGSSFSSDSVEVFFGTLPAAAVEHEGGSLFAVVPPELAMGMAHDIRVVNRGKGADTLSAAFELVAPRALRINGVSKPTGLVGMTIIIDGDAFGDRLDLSGGTVWFSGDAGPIEAVVTDTANDWSNSFVVTSVPQGVPDTSMVWVETLTGVSDSIEFRLIQSGVFSPATIAWSTTTPLPQPLQGLGAAFVPVEEGPTPANYVFAVGGADTMAVATNVVYRAVVQQTGALDTWTEVTALPEERAYHALAAATGYTAALDTTTTAAYLYVIGGEDSATTAVRTTHYVHVALDGTVGQWQTGPELPVGLKGAGAVIFRGFIYLIGGQDDAGEAVATSYRARVARDGSLGEWETLPALPRAAAFGSVVNFGPYIYSVGGDAGGAPPLRPTTTGTESAEVHLARINLRTGGFRSEGWVQTAAMAKARSKHSALVGGGAVFTTSGVYSGQPGSSENTYATFMTGGNGLLDSWAGATGSDIIANALGYSVYNQAAIYFIDDNGDGHVLVLGGARHDMPGVPSDGVVYY